MCTRYVVYFLVMLINRKKKCLVQFWLSKLHDGGLIKYPLGVLNNCIVEKKGVKEHSSDMVILKEGIGLLW